MSAEQPTCGTCKFWRQEAAEVWKGGICRRYPPALIVRFAGTAWTDKLDQRRPTTGAPDWCGEHTPKEPT